MTVLRPSPGEGRWQQFGAVLKGVWREKKFHEKGKYGGLVDAWAEVAGAEIAARTNIRSFKGGELVIELDSAVLLHEMNGFMKQGLLAGLQSHEGARDVSGLRFCLGRGSNGKQEQK